MFNSFTDSNKSTVNNANFTDVDDDDDNDNDDGQELNNSISME